MLKETTLGALLALGCMDAAKDEEIARLKAQLAAKQKPTSAAQPAPVIPLEQIPRVSFSGLVAEYEKNEIAADTKYKDKPLRVFGPVREVNKDILGKPQIVFGLAGVICQIKDSQAERASGLKRGDKVELAGVVKGKMMAVIMDRCIIVASP